MSFSYLGESSGGLYHVINLGNYRRAIFKSVGARLSFEKTLAEWIGGMSGRAWDGDAESFWSRVSGPSNSLQHAGNLVPDKLATTWTNVSPAFHV